MIKRIFFLFCLFTANGIMATEAENTEIKIAVASNFKATAQEIAEKFSQKTGHKITLISGSSSALLSMIIHGSPIDIFLSADKERPSKLISMRLGKQKNLTHYANGQLVFLSPNSEISSLSNIREKINKQTSKLAIANPKLAPYGLSSIKFIQELFGETIKKSILTSKLVMGNNVIQAMQFVTSGNAGSGFVSYSQIKQANITDHFYVLPQDSYSPIEQYAIITNRGSKKTAAIDFMSFLKNDSKNIISNAGYLVDNLHDE